MRKHEQAWSPSNHCTGPASASEAGFSSFEYGPSSATPGDLPGEPAMTVPGSNTEPAAEQLPPSTLFQPGPSEPGGDVRARERRELMKTKRRVPSAQRKRTQTSCDMCKTRRCKCLRLQPTPEANIQPDSDGLYPCKLCTDMGISCVTSIARKHRVYGSVENLDKRYRVLEAIVFGTFPDLNPEASVDELITFGRERGIPMPDLKDDPPRRSRPGSDIGTSSPIGSQGSTASASQILSFDPGPIQDYDAGALEYEIDRRSRSLESPQEGFVEYTGERPHYIEAFGNMAFW